MATESDDDRVHRLESVNCELRVALKECREQLERLKRLLARWDQDNEPREQIKQGSFALSGMAAEAHSNPPSEIALVSKIHFERAKASRP